jgi:Ca2+-binding EF-hand superfamily protein
MSSKNLTGKKGDRHVIEVFRNKDPSLILPEVGGLRIVADCVEFIGVDVGEGGKRSVFKEWKWDQIKDFASIAGLKDGEFDTFTMEVEGEGTYEFEAEICDHIEGSFNVKLWDAKTYQLHATKQQRSICKSAFEVLDLDGGGNLSRKEMKRMVKLLGKRFTKQCKTLLALMENADKENVCFDKFMEALDADQNEIKSKSKVDAVGSDKYRFLSHSTLHKLDQVADVRKAFDAIDADGSGELDLEEMGKCLRQLGHNIKKKKLKELMDTLGEPGTYILTWLQFVDSVADGTLDELQFASGVLEVENLVLLSDEGAHFIFAFQDPSKSLPEEVLLRIGDADLDIHEATGEKQCICSWGWADVEEFFTEEEDDPDPEDMDLFHIIYLDKEYIFECDEGRTIEDAMHKFQDAFVEKKKAVAKAMSLISEMEKNRIKSVFQCIDIDGSGEISLKECVVMLRVLGYDLSAASAIGGRMDRAGDGYISFSDFLEAVIERQSPSAVHGEITLFDAGEINILGIYALFVDCDEDRSGKVDKFELSKLITELLDEKKKATSKSSKDKKKNATMSKRVIEKLWAKLDADKTGSVTWFEFLESVGDGDFHALGLDHIFKGDHVASMTIAHQQVLASQFRERVKTEQLNGQLFDEIEASAMVDDLVKRRKLKATMQNLTSEQVRMLEILFCVFDYQGKGNMSTDGITTILKILDRWDIEVCLMELDKDGGGSIDWEEFIVWFDKEGCTPMLANTIGKVVKDFCVVYNIFDSYNAGKMKMAISRLDQALDTLAVKEKIVTRTQGLQAVKVMKKRHGKSKDACRITWKIFSSELGNFITENRLNVANYLPKPSKAELTMAFSKIAENPKLLLWWQIEVDIKDFKKFVGIVIGFKDKKHELLIKQNSSYFRRVVRVDHRRKLTESVKDNCTFDLVCFMPINIRPKNVEVLGLTKKELETYKIRHAKEEKKKASDKAKADKKAAKGGK